jgi:hypothetical protein
MKRYHMLTQAHINHYFQAAADRANYKGQDLSHWQLAIRVLPMLKKAGFNPRQIKRASEHE